MRQNWYPGRAEEDADDGERGCRPERQSAESSFKKMPGSDEYVAPESVQGRAVYPCITALTRSICGGTAVLEQAVFKK